MALRRVVVTGLGALTPLGNSVEEYWNNCLKGKSGAGPITLFDVTKFKTRFACEVKGLEVLDFIDRKEARKMDRFTHHAIISSDQAIADSGLNVEGVDRTRIGVIWGSGEGGLKAFEDEIVEYAQNDLTPRFNPFFIPKQILDIAPGWISMRNGFMGPNYATVSACASSTNALIDAVSYIRLGYADAIVSGGSEACVSATGLGGFNAMRALSTRNDDPTTASRPYDKDRDGFVLAEGGVCLILEDLEHAIKRGAKIYAEACGVGMSADAHHLTAPHPEGEGAKLVMNNALRDAQMQPADLDYINTHGTSTPLGDIAELKALKSVFGEHVYDMNISSTKSMTGHMLGAAGAVEAMTCVLAVQNDVVPPTINHFTDDPDIDPKLNLTFNSAEKRTVRAALTNTFGFGGHNACAIFKKYEG